MPRWSVVADRSRCPGVRLEVYGSQHTLQHTASHVDRTQKLIVTVAVLTFASESCRSRDLTRARVAPPAPPPGRRSAAWKHRNSHTVDVPGRMSSCGTYPAAARTCGQGLGFR